MESSVPTSNGEPGASNGILPEWEKAQQALASLKPTDGKQQQPPTQHVKAAEPAPSVGGYMPQPYGQSYGQSYVQQQMYHQQPYMQPMYPQYDYGYNMYPQYPSMPSAAPPPPPPPIITPAPPHVPLSVSQPSVSQVSLETKQSGNDQKNLPSMDVAKSSSFSSAASLSYQQGFVSRPAVPKNIPFSSNNNEFNSGADFLSFDSASPAKNQNMVHGRENVGGMQQYNPYSPQNSSGGHPNFTQGAPRRFNQPPDTSGISFGFQRKSQNMSLRQMAPMRGNNRGVFNPLKGSRFDHVPTPSDGNNGQQGAQQPIEQGDQSGQAFMQFGQNERMDNQGGNRFGQRRDGRQQSLQAPFGSQWKNQGREERTIPTESRDTVPSQSQQAWEGKDQQNGRPDWNVTQEYRGGRAATPSISESGWNAIPDWQKKLNPGSQRSQQFCLELSGDMKNGDTQQSVGEGKINVESQRKPTDGDNVNNCSGEVPVIPGTQPPANTNEWPPKLKAYIQRCFASVSDLQKDAMEVRLKGMLTNAFSKGYALTVNWDTEPVITLSSPAAGVGSSVNKVGDSNAKVLPCDSTTYSPRSPRFAAVTPNSKSKWSAHPSTSNTRDSDDSPSTQRSLNFGSIHKRRGSGGQGRANYSGKHRGFNGQPWSPPGFRRRSRSTSSSRSRSRCTRSQRSRSGSRSRGSGSDSRSPHSQKRPRNQRYVKNMYNFLIFRF